MTFTYQQCGSITNISSYPHFVGRDTSVNAQPIGVDFSRGENKEAVFININKQLYGFKYNGNPIDPNSTSGTMFGIRADWLPGYFSNWSAVNGIQHTSLISTVDSIIEIRDFIINDTVNSNFGTISYYFGRAGIFSSPAVIYDTNKIVEGTVPGNSV